MQYDLVVYTNESFDEVVKNGGTGWWRSSMNSLNKVKHVILCDNYGRAFAVGEFDRADQTERNVRRFLHLTRIAEIDIDGFWQGWRNPLRYIPTMDHYDLFFNNRTLSWIELGHDPLEDGAPETIQSIMQEAQFKIGYILNTDPRNVTLSMSMQT